jgi:hypothetical protein
MEIKNISFAAKKGEEMQLDSVYMFQGVIPQDAFYLIDDSGNKSDFGDLVRFDKNIHVNVEIKIS